MLVATVVAHRLLSCLTSTRAAAGRCCGYVGAHLGSATGLNLSGVLALAVLTPVATVIFARRRYHEALTVRSELVRLSLHDPLTGLPNRMLLSDWLAADIQSSQRRNSQAAVLFVDLDRFKHVRVRGTSPCSTGR